MQEATCYFPEAGRTVLAKNALPCGITNSTHPNVACCYRQDQCLSDNLCGYSHSNPNGSGYYAGGCTNKDFGDGCDKRCESNERPDVKYNETNKIWNCCVYPIGGALNCNMGNSEQFKAAQPPFTIVRLPMSGTPTYAAANTAGIPSSNSTSTLASPSSLTPSSSPNSSSSTATPHMSSVGLSTGAKAGIGVGAAIGAVVLSAIVLLVWRSYRSKRVQEVTGLRASMGCTEMEPDPSKPELNELPASSSQMAELDLGYLSR